MDIDNVVTAKRVFKGSLTHLKVYPIEQERAQKPVAKRKVEVLRDILKDDEVYYTGEFDEDEVTLNLEVRVVVGESMAYLRSDGQSIEEDYLPNLTNF